MTTDQLLLAARNVFVEPNLEEGVNEVTPGVYLFMGVEMMSSPVRQQKYYAIEEGDNIRIETA